MAKTRRSPDGIFAGGGAVNQHEGSLPIYICNECERQVVWVTSTRTGRKYLANISRGANGHRFYIGANVHTHESPSALAAALDTSRLTAIDDAIDERDVDYEAQYDDFAAERFAEYHGLAIQADGQFVEIDERDASYADPGLVSWCPYRNASYCTYHDYDHVLARRELELDDDFNERWAGYKNEFARLERAQEERAFMSKLDR